MPKIKLDNDSNYGPTWGGGGNLSTRKSAWDNILQHIMTVHYDDTPCLEMLSHQTLNNLHQYTTTDQALTRGNSCNSVHTSQNHRQNTP